MDIMPWDRNPSFLKGRNDQRRHRASIPPQPFRTTLCDLATGLHEAGSGENSGSLRQKDIGRLGLGQETSEPCFPNAFLEEMKFQLVSENIFSLGENILG